MDQIIRVNLEHLTSTIEAVPDAWAGLGGRALTSTIVAAEVPPTCHPLGPNNKLVFAPGLLSGTAASNSGRLSAGAKSPLTGGIKESNAGGTAAQMFARLGIKALIIEGMPKDDNWYSLHVSKDGVTIQEESELMGQGNFAVIEALEARLGKKIGVISIGPAGEMKMTAANISVKDPDGKIRSHGRGGLGRGDGLQEDQVHLHRRRGRARASASPIRRRSRPPPGSSPRPCSTTRSAARDCPTYGTNVLVNILNEAGGLPTRNFTYGQFDGHDKISGETMHDTIVARGGKPKHGCHAGCIIQCSQVYNDKDGKYLTSGFEYETIWGLGADCCIEDLDDIATADSLMDDHRHRLHRDRGHVRRGHGSRHPALRRRQGRAAHAARGDRQGHPARPDPRRRARARSGRTYGVTRVPVVKNQAIPAYDPAFGQGHRHHLRHQHPWAPTTPPATPSPPTSSTSAAMSIR